MADKVLPDALEVLRACWVEGDVVKLPPAQLPRPVYEGVKEPLERIKGKWKGGKTNCFVFPYDPSPLLSLIQETGEMPPRNPTAFFPTPAAVVAEMIDQVRKWWLFDGCRILEPSAGTGAICDGVAALALEGGYSVEIDCVEFLAGSRDVLAKKGYRVVGEDFTLFSPNQPYDLIVMNPPFSLEGDKLAWLTHVERAWGMLKEGGLLLAIIPNALGHRNTKRVDEFRDVAGLYGWWEALEDGAFKESGTGVSTCLLRMDKLDQSWRETEFNGWPNWHSWLVALYAENTRQDHDATLAATQKGPDALREHLETVADKARRGGEPARLKASDHPHLWQHFAETFDVPLLQVAECAPEPVRDDLGGLFSVEALKEAA